MSKLYLFCIGGTGHRVLKSLIMLLAGGMKLNTDELVPIILDPDANNGDLTRTKVLINLYNEIRSKLCYESDNRFKERNTSLFYTKLSKLREATDCVFQLDGAINQSFEDFLDFNSTELSEHTKALLTLFYSRSNLELRMDEGFKGYPNIGTVVLNQIKDSQVFLDFASDFHQGDKIFIVSSIFGGTGASGLPLLLKNIRNAPNLNIQNGGAIPNANLLQNSIIGALTVLPYFSVEEDNNSIISGKSFIPKTKSALLYYKNNISNLVNTLYYIADPMVMNYKNHPGSMDQKNFAHIIEIAGAVAIKDFLDLDDGNFNIQDGFVENTIFKEFGIRNECEELNFTTFGIKTKNCIFEPITKLVYTFLYLEKGLKNNINRQPWSKIGSVSQRLDKSFFDSFYYKNIKDFEKLYSDWLIELASNERKFIPFSFLGNAINISNETENRQIWKCIFTEQIDKRNLFKIINGISDRRNSPIYRYRFYDDFDYFNDKLNKYIREFNDFSKEQKFIGIFDKAISEIINEKIIN